MQFPIEGSVSLSNGSATLRLKPASVEVVYVQAPRPTVEDVQLWDVHSSRLPMNKKVLASAMVCVQKQLGIPTGISGVWTQDATRRLQTNLAKPKKAAQAHPSSPPQLALEDMKHLPPQPKRKRSSSSSSSSTSSAAKRLHHGSHPRHPPEHLRHRSHPRHPPEHLRHRSHPMYLPSLLEPPPKSFLHRSPAFKPKIWSSPMPLPATRKSRKRLCV